jgi:hypothetical protein
MLQFTLVENFLTDDPNDFMVQPVNVKSRTLQEIFKRIEDRETGLTYAQVSASVLEFFSEVYTITEEGETVNTLLFNTLWSTPGSVEGAAGSVDFKKHPAKINLYPGTGLREAARKVKTQKVIVADPVPHILEVKDIVGGTVNENLTPGGVIQLKGGRLKFLQTEENNGIFLVGEHGEEIKLTVIVENKPSRLIAVMPNDVPQGDYFIEVRTSSSATGKPMKSLKKSNFNKILTVV